MPIPLDRSWLQYDPSKESYRLVLAFEGYELFFIDIKPLADIKEVANELIKAGHDLLALDLSRSSKFDTEHHFFQSRDIVYKLNVAYAFQLRNQTKNDPPNRLFSEASDEIMKSRKKIKELETVIANTKKALLWE